MTSGIPSPRPQPEEVFRFCDGALEGNKFLVSQYLDKYGADGVDLKSGDSTALSLAAWHGHKEIVDVLLQHNASTEKTGLFSMTPLMFAACGGHLDVARLLLEKGALVNTVNVDRKTAADLARDANNPDVADLIEHWSSRHLTPVLNGKSAIRRGDRIPYVGTAGGSPSQQEVNDFCSAAEKGNNAAVKEFLRRWGTAHIDSRGENDNAALQIAAWRGQRETVALLLKNGADINQKGFQNRAAVTFAILSKDIDTLRLLLESGADIKKADVDQDWTVERWAIWSEDPQIIDLIEVWSEKQALQQQQEVADKMNATATEDRLQKLRRVCPAKKAFKKSL